MGICKRIPGNRHHRGLDGQHSRIDALERVNNRVVPRIVITGINSQGINRQARHDEGFLVGVEIGVQENAISAERREGLEQSFRYGFEVLAAVNGEAQRRMSARIDVENGADFVELVFMLLDVSARTVRELFFARKKYEANGVLGLDSQKLENAGGFEHSGDARAVVVRTLCGIPGIEMGAEEDHFAGIRTWDICDDVAFFAGSGKERNVVADIDRKSTRLNSSHLVISYAVFCLKKKKKKHQDYCEQKKNNNAQKR